MKKRLKDTKGGKIIGGLINGFLRSSPIIGEVVENLRSDEGGSGKLDPKTLVTQIIRLVSFALLVWQFTKGNISLDMILNF